LRISGEMFRTFSLVAAEYLFFVHVVQVLRNFAAAIAAPQKAWAIRPPSNPGGYLYSPQIRALR
jgi:hypothetical protein